MSHAIRSLLVLLILAPIVRADDIARSDGKTWTMFRGNSALTGVAPENALPEKLELLWSFKTKQHIESSAAIVGGVVYVGTDNTSDGGVFAVELATGVEKWRFKTENAVRSSPAVADGKVFVGDDGGILYAIHAADGKLAWKFAAEDKIAGSPVVSGDKVLAGSYDSFLYCLNTADGKVAWKFKTEDQPINCTPAVSGGAAFISGCDQFLRVVDIKTGKQIAQVNMDGQAGASPAIVGDKAYVGTFANNVLGIDWKTEKVIWTYKHPDKDFAFYSSAAISGDRILVGGRDKMLHCLDRGSGRAHWTFQTRAKVDSSPTVVGERVFFGSYDGNLYGLKISDGSKLFTYALGSPVAASPAVAEGCLVIGGDDGVLFCFGKKPN